MGKSPCLLQALLIAHSREYDPWRSAGVSSRFRPGGPVAHTPSMPVFLIPRAVHAQDLYMDDVIPEVLKARSKEIAQLKVWVDEYYHQPPPSNTMSSAPALTTTLSPVSSSRSWPNSTYKSMSFPSNRTRTTTK
jgi:hypothetical protein